MSTRRDCAHHRAFGERSRRFFASLTFPSRPIATHPRPISRESNAPAMPPTCLRNCLRVTNYVGIAQVISPSLILSSDRFAIAAQLFTSELCMLWESDYYVPVDMSFITFSLNLVSFSAFLRYCILRLPFATPFDFLPTQILRPWASRFELSFVFVLRGSVPEFHKAMFSAILGAIRSAVYWLIVS